MILHSVLILLKRMFISVVLLSFVAVNAEDNGSFVAWKPDGQMLAVSSGTTVKIFDSNTMQLLHTLSGLSFQVTEPSWSPDGSKLAVANGGKVDIWQNPSSPILAQITSSLTYDSAYSYIYSVAWSPNGTRIAVANGVGDIWDVSSAQILYSLTAHRNDITQIVWSPDSLLLATGSLDSTVKIWAASDGQLLNSMIVATNLSPPEDRAAVFSVGWDPTGTKLVFGAYEDGTVRIWDQTTLNSPEMMMPGNVPGVLYGHGGGVISFSWHPNGNFLASGGEDGTVRIWDVGTGQAIEVIQTSTETVYSVAWSPDGSQLAYGGEDGVLHIVAVSELAPVDGSDSNACAEQQQDCATPARTQDQVYSVVWSPDGSMIAISGGEIGCDDIPTGRFPVRIFSATTGQITKHLLGMTCTSSGLDWSPDGQKLVSFNVAQSIAYIWDVPSENLILTVPFESQGMFSVNWSPNSNLIASAFPGDGIIIWDCSTGQIVGPVLRGSVIAWSPDGNLIAAGNRYNNEISILDISTGNELLTLTGTTDVTSAIDWSGNGSRIVSASSDDKVWVWNAANGQLLSTFSIPNVVTDVKWSPDGLKIATAGFDAATDMGFIRVLNAASGIQLVNFSHSERLLSVSWSPEGTQLAYAAADGILHIVDVSDLPLLETSP